MKRRCPKCDAEWDGPDRIGVREECPECAAFLHTCVNCARFDPSTGTCTEPDVEAVRDPYGASFCEWFAFEADAARRAAPPPEVSERSSEEDARRKFEDLFGGGGS
ncbi:MAG: hypothetical protein R6X20_18975 [Phycisphaerae bacterium]